MRRGTKSVGAILCDQKQQQLANRSPVFGGWVLIDHLGSFQLHANCSRNTCTTACHGAGQPLLIYELNFTKINHNLSFRPFLESHKPSIYPRVPKQIPQADPASVIVVWVEEGILVLLTPSSSQNPLLAWVFNSFGFSGEKKKYS